MLGYLSRSGFALLGWVTNIVLVPVLTFFFLRDWDVFVERIAALVPRDQAPTVSRLARESSDVLGGFLRARCLVWWSPAWFLGVARSPVGRAWGVLSAVSEPETQGGGKRGG